MSNKCSEIFSKEDFSILLSKLELFLENQEDSCKNYVLSEIVKKLDGLLIWGNDDKTCGHKVFCTYDQGKSLFKIRLVPFYTECRCLVYHLQSEISLKL